MRRHIDSLRDALLELPVTGAEGFEGLLSATLTEITGVPFRLAGSGSQFGVDGKATYAADAVCFEAKRYDGNIPRTEILEKVDAHPQRARPEIQRAIRLARSSLGRRHCGAFGS